MAEDRVDRWNERKLHSGSALDQPDISRPYLARTRHPFLRRYAGGQASATT